MSHASLYTLMSRFLTFLAENGIPFWRRDPISKVIRQWHISLWTWTDREGEGEDHDLGSKAGSWKMRTSFLWHHMAFILRQTLIFGTLEILVTQPFSSLEMARFEPSGLPWSEYQAIALPTELFCLDLRKCATNTKDHLKRKMKMANYWKLDVAALLGIPAEVVFWFELGSFWFGFGQNWFWAVLAVFVLT